MIVDATDQIVGRLASHVAKALIKGEKVVIVNAEHAVVSGRPTLVKKEYYDRVVKGDPYHGPFYPKQPHLILRRAIRGMIPYKTKKGREAFKNLRVHLGVPEEFKSEKPVQFEKAAGSKITETKLTTLESISTSLGVKKRW